MMERLFEGVTVGRERVIRIVQSSHYSQRLEVEVERRSLRWADITHTPISFFELFILFFSYSALPYVKATIPVQHRSAPDFGTSV